MLIIGFALGPATRDARTKTTPGPKSRSGLSVPDPHEARSGRAHHGNEPTDYTISTVLDDGRSIVLGDTYHPAYQPRSRPEQAAAGDFGRHSRVV
jgi:hypothetical protein